MWRATAGVKRGKRSRRRRHCVLELEASAHALPGALEVADPCLIAHRRRLVLHVGRPEAVHQDEGRDALGLDARVAHRGRRAHRVADQHGAATERAHQEGEVGGVVGEVVVASAAHPLGVAVTPPVEGEDVPASGGEARGDQVPGVGMLQEAMEQEKDRRVSLPPVEQVMAQAVGDDEAVARRHRTASTIAVPAGPSRSTAVDSSNRATIM
jgi:hypothetical protein